MIRSLRELQESMSRYRDQRRPSYIHQGFTSDSSTVEMRMSFSAVITGSEMWWDNMQHYAQTCNCHCAEPPASADDIFPRKYLWEATWGGMAQLLQTWGQVQQHQLPPGSPSWTLLNQIQPRAMLAANLYEGTRAPTCQCGPDNCPACDPRCQLGFTKVPDGTPVIMNIAPWPTIVDPTGSGGGGGGGGGATQGGVIIPWPFVFFWYYFDPPSCVCDYPSDPEHCP